MSQDFEKWLASNRKRDENVIKGEKIIDELRQQIKNEVFDHLTQTDDQTWCKCDTCTIIRLKAENESIITKLAYVGLEYLLGQNYNNAAALYYYSYMKKRLNEI